MLAGPITFEQELINAFVAVLVVVFLGWFAVVTAVVLVGRALGRSGAQGVVPGSQAAVLVAVAVSGVAPVAFAAVAGDRSGWSVLVVPLVVAFGWGFGIGRASRLDSDP